MKLEAGKEYVVIHKSKGSVRGRFLGEDPGLPGDLLDKKLLRFVLETGPESGQERLARAVYGPTGQPVSRTVARLRPSKILEIIPSTRSPILERVDMPKAEIEEAKSETMGVKKRIFKKLFRR